MFLALALALIWTYMLVSRPDVHAPLAERKTFAEQLLILTGAMVLALVAAGVGSALIVRRAREEFREESLRNLKSLIESESDKSEA